LPLPTNIASGSTVSLQCGQVYRGTLDLSNKSNVTVNVAGTCGKPTIIPTSNTLNGINASASSSITINGIKIQDSVYGIYVPNSTKISIQNTDIVNSSEAGIFFSGVNGLTVQNSSVNHSGHTGLDSYGGVWNAVITNTTVNDSGYAGGSYRGIAFYIYGGSNNRLDHVTATNSVYHGIVVLQTPGSALTNSLSKNSCTGADHDCGAIYAGSPQQVVQNITFDSNKVDGSGGIGIYLDDSSNAITVSNNTVMNCDIGMVLHNAYNTVIQGNKLSGIRVKNFALSDDLGRMVNNKFTSNSVVISVGAQAYNLESRNLGGIMTSDYNAYSGSSGSNFARVWNMSSAGIDYTVSGWKSAYGQDAHSTFSP
jgi:parallel beta-helix repeat protein